MTNRRLIDAAIERTERVTIVLRKHGVDTLNLTEGWASPLRSGATGPRGKGGVSDPTGTSATAENDDREAHAYRDLCDAVADLEVAAAKVTHAIIRLRRLSPREAKVLFELHRGRQSSLSPCGCLHCEDRAPAGATHCEPCARYLAARPGTTQVPRYIILDRERKRSGVKEQQRGYVSGPFAQP